jgi:hypothetical protein
VSVTILVASTGVFHEDGVNVRMIGSAWEDESTLQSIPVRFCVEANSWGRYAAGTVVIPLRVKGFHSFQAG